MSLDSQINLIMLMISTTFAAGVSWGIYRWKIIYLKKDVERLRNRVKELETRDRNWIMFMAKVEEKLTRIEQDVLQIKKKLNIV